MFERTFLEYSKPRRSTDVIRSGGGRCPCSTALTVSTARPSAAARAILPGCSFFCRNRVMNVSARASARKGRKFICARVRVHETLDFFCVVCVRRPIHARWCKYERTYRREKNYTLPGTNGRMTGRRWTGLIKCLFQELSARVGGKATWWRLLID